jgi:hypothetical protein
MHFISVQVQSQPSKRIKFEENFKEAKNKLLHIPQCHSTEYRNAGVESSDHQPNESDNHLKLNAGMELKKLQLIVDQKKETLRKLNLVKMYRKKVY